MAIFHLSSKSHGRSDAAVIRNRAAATGIGDGARSIVARAAYRSGTKLNDVRAGKTWNYRIKERVRESFILTPVGAPDWTQDQEQLWNKVEAGAKRKDAQLARELEMSLPRELGPNQHRQMLVEFFAPIVEAGQICDVAIHEPHSRNDGQDQPHAHALLTISELTPEGFGRRRDPLAPAFAGRGRVSTADPLLALRARWAEITNSYLRAAGSAARVSHKTNIEQMADALASGAFKSALALCREPQTKGRDKQGHLKTRHNPIYAQLRPQLEDLVAQLDQLSTAERLLLGRELMKSLKLPKAAPKDTTVPAPHDKEKTMPQQKPQPKMSDPEFNRLAPKKPEEQKKKDDDTGSAGLSFSRQPIARRPAVAERRRKKLEEAQALHSQPELSRSEQFKADLLRKIYADAAAAELAKRAKFVRLLDEDGVEISIIGGGRVFDHGDRMTCGGDDQDQAREIEMLVKLAQAKRDENGVGSQESQNWNNVQVFGDDQFVAAAAYALALKGFQVAARDEAQASLVKRTVVDANRQLVADGVAPVGAKARVPDRIARIERERMDAMIDPFPDRLLASTSFCEVALQKKKKNEPKEEVLKRFAQTVRDWFREFAVPETAALTTVEFESLIRGTTDRLWSRVEAGEIKISDPPEPEAKLKQQADQQAGQQNSPGETMG